MNDLSFAMALRILSSLADGIRERIPSDLSNNRHAYSTCSVKCSTLPQVVCVVKGP